MAVLSNPVVRELWRRYQAVVWLALGLGFAALFLYQSGDDLRKAIPIIQTADPLWILAAIACQILIIGAIAERYRVVFSWMGAVPNLPTLIRAYLRRATLVCIVPLGGPIGLLRFVRDLEPHNVPAPTTLFGSFLAGIANQFAFVLFLVPVMGWMILSGSASTPLIVAAVTMLILIVAGGAALIFASQSGPNQQAFIDMMPERVRSGIETIREHNVQPRYLLQTVPHSLAINLLGTATLTFALWSIGVHPGLMTILTARLAASLAVVLLPVWQGAGALELTVLGALVAGGVSTPDALAAIAIFRFAQFWVPLGIGGLAFLPQLHPATLLRVRTAAVASSVAGVFAALFISR